MYEKCSADIRMKRMALKDGYFDEKIHYCKVVAYNPEEECIYLLLEDTELTGISLDGIYECRVDAANGTIGCIGIITERYWNKLGKVMKFRIKNGFYKNLVN